MCSLTEVLFSQWLSTTLSQKAVSALTSKLLDVLLCPKAPISKYRDLDTKEVFEMALATQMLTKFLQDYYGTDSATVSI